MSHDSNIVTEDQGQTFILAGYTISCNGTVVAWEFCYQISDAASVTFYPGIWRTEMRGSSGKIDYVLVKSNTVTFDPKDASANNYSCRMFHLLDTDQFTTPAESVVGLYSDVGPQLLRTNTDSSITTYQSNGNQSSFRANDNSITELRYNIAIRVHLGT